MQLQHIKLWASTSLLALGSASFIAMGPSAAAADELSALKAQLEALQLQVDDLASRPASPSPPEGVSLLTIARGSMEEEAFAHLTAPGDRLPGERGFTIAVTPAADLPAPVHEITIGGYVKGDVIYDFDGDNADFFAFTFLEPGDDDDHIRLHARQSRFNIKSRSETRIGEIRTLIEGDFFGGGSVFRLRHAFGEWDMTPVWTLGVGQTWSNFMPLWDLADTIDFNGPAGGSFKRQGQVRLTYHSGPILAAVAIEDPVTSAVFAFDFPLIPPPVPPADPSFAFRGEERVPDVTGRLEYTLPGDHKLGVTGVVGENRIDTPGGEDDEFFWGVIGAGQIHALEHLIVTASGGYGEGHGRYVIGVDAASNIFLDAADSPMLEGREFWHFQGHVNYGLTETVSLNAAYGRVDFRSSDTLRGQTDWLQTVHGNILWRPVSQLKMGVEAMWAERDIEGIAEVDATRVQFGAWFFF